MAYVVAFLLCGACGAASVFAIDYVNRRRDGWLARTSQHPDISLRIVNPEAIALTVLNDSGLLVRNIRYSIIAWNLDSKKPGNPGSLPYINETIARMRDDDVMRPFGYTSLPSVAAQVKKGDRLLGIAEVECPDCLRPKAYWVYTVHGVGGWFAESLPGKYPNKGSVDQQMAQIRVNPDGFLSELPETSRIQITDFSADGRDVMPSKDDDKSPTNQQITGQGHRVAGRDYYEQGRPEEPLPVSQYQFHSEKVSTDNPDAPYGLKVVVQSSIVRHPVSIVVLCDGPFVTGDWRMVGGGAYMMSGEGSTNNGTGYWFFFKEPALRPETPVIVTLQSKSPLRVLGAYDGPPSPFGG